MDVGILMPFASDGWEGISDSRVYEEELGLARLADGLGFNVAWAAEHHFFGYSFCPDNTQLLSYLAGVTSQIEVGTAAVIMPWNEPLRVAEKVALLDNVSEIPVPAKAVTSVAFGGPGMADRYIVTADNLDEAAKRGTIFHAKPDVAGLPTPLASV